MTEEEAREKMVLEREVSVVVKEQEQKEVVKDLVERAVEVKAANLMEQKMEIWLKLSVLGKKLRHELHKHHRLSLCFFLCKCSHPFPK